jgi:ribosomal protein L11 methyltransferase
MTRKACRQDRVPLLIEAAMAFGTGHHGTTKGCLDGLRPPAVAGGCAAERRRYRRGHGGLAIAAAKTTPNPVIASDIDPVAVEVAEANARANGVGSKVHCIEAAGFDHPDLAAGAPYDLVFANILKGPLVALAPDMRAHVAPGGHAILSGILNEQADDVIAAYADGRLHPRGA